MLLYFNNNIIIDNIFKVILDSIHINIQINLFGMIEEVNIYIYIYIYIYVYIYIYIYNMNLRHICIVIS